MTNTNEVCFLVVVWALGAEAYGGLQRVTEGYGRLRRVTEGYGVKAVIVGKQKVDKTGPGRKESADE